MIASFMLLMFHARAQSLSSAACHRRSLPPPSAKMTMSISGDGSRTAAAFYGGTLEVWENRTGKVLMHRDHQPWAGGELHPINAHIDYQSLSPVAIDFHGK